MTCHDIVALSSEILDRQASPREQALFERHVATCAECATRHDELAVVTRMLKSSEPLSLEPAQEEAIFSRLDRDTVSTFGALRRALSPLTWPFRFLASGTGSGVALLMVIGLLWPSTGALAPIAEPVRKIERVDAVFTVWDSEAERIVAAVTSDDSWTLPQAFDSMLDNAPAVRIFLFERIVVRG